MMRQFEIVCKVGEGTFGSVFKAKHIPTGRIVALKRIRIRRLEEGIPKNLLREVKALQQLDSAHVVKLLDFFPDGSSVVFSFEFMETDLLNIMKGMVQFQRSFTQVEIKSILLMLLQSVVAVHQCNIIHRDIKPANVLFSEHGVLKLGDFGLARVHDPPTTTNKEGYSHEVATRWYRAPELLFGSRNYGNEVDVWAVGCIFGELLNHSPMFPGENDIDQLYRILKVLGSPSVDSWPEVKDLPDYNKITFPHLDAIPLNQVLPDAPPQAIALLQKMLVLNPCHRITAKQALHDEYFSTPPLPVHPSQLIPLIQIPSLAKHMQTTVPDFSIDDEETLESTT